VKSDEKVIVNENNWKVYNRINMEKRCQWSYWYPTRLLRKSSGGIYKLIIDTIPVVAEKASSTIELKAFYSHTHVFCS
jgi:hypothetical protein